MQNRKLLMYFVPVLLSFVSLEVIGANNPLFQSNDSLGNQEKMAKRVPLEPYHRNVIKFNPTPMLLFSEVRNFTLSYERLITRNQSIAIQAGYLLLPRLKFLEKLNKTVTFAPKEKYGINLALDYRYYLFPRNNRPAPDGLYAGAFVSYYSFYSGELGISGGLDPSLVEEIDKDLVEAVEEQFPLLGALLNGENLEFTGNKSKWKFGFRYSIQVGFHF